MNSKEKIREFVLLEKSTPRKQRFSLPGITIDRLIEAQESNFMRYIFEHI